MQEEILFKIKIESMKIALQITENIKFFKSSSQYKDERGEFDRDLERFFELYKTIEKQIVGE